MELKQYWNLLWKWKWLVILGTLLAAAAAFLVSRNMTPVYQTTTALMVTPGAPQSSESYSTLVASERLAQTYAQLLESEALLKETFARLGLLQPGDPEAETDNADAGFSLSGLLERLLSSVGLGQPGDAVSEPQIPDFSFSAEPVRDTQLITVRVEGTDPDWITEAANTLVDVFVGWQRGIQKSRFSESKTNLAAGMQRVQADIEETETAIRTLEGQGETADKNELARLQDQLAQYRSNYSALLNSYSNIDLAEANSAATITVVSPAVRPRFPIRPRVMTNTLLAAVLGGIAAVGAAFLIEYLDDTVKSPEDLQTIGLHMIAAVQRARSIRGNEPGSLFTLSQPRSLISESYRTLRTNLQFSSPDKPLRSLVVTSAVATEGKTTTASNLAIVMAQDGKTVVLLDADLRRPSVHRVFGLSNRAGLTNALMGDREALRGYLQDTEVKNLRVLTAGPVPHNPQELLGSRRMADLLQALQEQADVVVIDTPPSLAVADANVLSVRTDGVLIVVNTGKTRRDVLQQAVTGLRKVEANLVGGVLNMMPSRRGSGYYYSHYYYHEEYGSGDGGGQSSLIGRRRRRSTSGESQVKPAPSEG